MPVPHDPTQDDVNLAQGVVDDLQGDLNELSAQRADRSEAKAAAGVEQRDAEHADQAVTNRAVSDRADVSEGAAATADTRREGQFDAQAVQNERREGQFDRQAVTNAAQAGVNADQLVINDEAVKALGDIGLAAQAVTALLAENVKRTRYWTYLLGGVLAVVIVLGLVGWSRFNTVTDESRVQRDHIVANAADVAAQRARACAASIKRTEAIKTELNFLVDYAIGEHNKNPALRQFKADYPGHLAKVIPAVDCR